MPREEENVGGQLDKSQEFFCGLLVNTMHLLRKPIKSDIELLQT
jgi:hypothetical protein